MQTRGRHYRHSATQAPRKLVPPALHTSPLRAATSASGQRRRTPNCRWGERAVLNVQDSISSNIAATFRGVAGTNRIGLGTIAGITDGTPFAQGFSSSFAAVDMTLQPNGGNVGIGTTSPGTLLSIGGTGTGINFVDGTTATSTISGNLWVKGTLRTGTGSLYMNDTGITSSDGNLSLQRNGVSYLNGGNLALGANSLTMTGSLGATGARLTKGWFTDLQVSNTIAGAINGNAGSAALPPT